MKGDKKALCALEERFPFCYMEGDDVAIVAVYRNQPRRLSSVLEKNAEKFDKEKMKCQRALLLAIAICLGGRRDNIRRILLREPLEVDYVYLISCLLEGYEDISMIKKEFHKIIEFMEANDIFLDEDLGETWNTLDSEDAQELLEYKTQFQKRIRTCKL